MTTTATQVPHDEAERHILGSLMHTAEAIEDVSAILEPGDMHAPRHEIVYAAILALHARGDAVDPVTVAAELTRTGQLAQAGGHVYLGDLFVAPATTSNAGYYARIVRDQAMWRRLWAAGTRIAQTATAGEGDPGEAVEEALAHVGAVSRATATTGWVSDTIDATIDDLEAPSRLTPTPWVDLDRYLGGWAPGRSYVIAARPGVGKSLVATNIARELARTAPVALSSLEMSAGEIQHRLIAAITGVDLTHLSEHRLTDDDWSRVSTHRDAIRGLRISIDDRAGATCSDVVSHARTVARRAGAPLGAVIVDYLQLLASDRGRRAENRQTEVAAWSRRLKVAARELACPVIVLSQLNRTSEARADRRPTMGDLRESGAIEQDADVVILLHVDEDDPNALLVSVAKNRHGPTGALTLNRDGAHARITSRAWSPTGGVDRR